MKNGDKSAKFGLKSVAMMFEDPNWHEATRISVTDM